MQIRQVRLGPSFGQVRKSTRIVPSGISGNNAVFLQRGLKETVLI